MFLRLFSPKRNFPRAAQFFFFVSSQAELIEWKTAFGTRARKMFRAQRLDMRKILSAACVHQGISKKTKVKFVLGKLESNIVWA